MHSRGWLRTLGSALLVGALAAGAAAVAEDEKSYQFFFPKSLASEAEKHVGKPVKVVDTLVKIWEAQEIEGYLRFDTLHFRCAVPASETESIAYLREVLKLRHERKDATPPLVAIYGTLAREPLFGPVKGGEEAGVASEEILIKVDKVERPRDRFWDEPN